MSQSTTSDLLSAQSVLLAILTALYGYWKPEFDRVAVYTPRSDRKEDNTDLSADLRGALWVRALPLTLYAAALALIFIRSTVETVSSTWKCGTACDFDEIGASSVAVEIGLVWVAVALFRTTWKLNGTYKSIPH